jgi:hypothetical protein
MLEPRRRIRILDTLHPYALGTAILYLIHGGGDNDTGLSNMGLIGSNKTNWDAMPAAELRNRDFSAKALQNNADFLLGGECARGGFLDLFDEISGHGGSSLQCAMTSFGEVDGECHAPGRGGGGIPSPPLPLLSPI